MLTDMQLNGEDAAMTTPTPDKVTAAAGAIVDAFARTDTRAYFDAFDTRATFVFHPEPDVLHDRAAYEELWDSWLASGWRVVGCESSNPHVLTYPGMGIFTHDVRTVTENPGGREETRERESIVFAEVDGQLLAVHEHLSPAPLTGSKS